MWRGRPAFVECSPQVLPPALKTRLFSTPSTTLHCAANSNVNLSSSSKRAAGMRICIYEDRHVRGLEPITLTRPVIDLLCGLTTLGEKQVRYFSATALGHLCRPLVAEQIRMRDPVSRVNDPGWLRAAPTVLVNARWIPPTQKRTVGLIASRRGVGIGSSNLFADGSYLGTV